MEIVQVAAVNPVYPSIGGIRSHVLGLSEALSKLGVHVTVVGAGPAPTNDLRNYDFVSVTERMPISSLKFITSLLRASKRISDSRTILHAHRPDDLAALALRSDVRARVLTIHGLPSTGIRQRHGVIAAQLYSVMEIVGLRLANRIVLLDELTREDFLRTKPRNAAKTVLGWSGVDLEMFVPSSREAARAALGIPEEPTIAFVGRLAPEKNLSLLVDSCRMIPDAQLIIAGDGPARTMLRSSSRTRPNLFLLGPVDHAKVADVMNAADVLALPSQREALPVVILEALACGTPVVATRVGAVSELIQDGRNGFVADATQDAFAARLRLALARSATMRETCRQTAQRYGWGRVAKKMLELYKEVGG